MNGAVAFLDVLGWKGIWMRRENPIQDLKEVIADAQKIDATIRKRTDSEIWKPLDGLNCAVTAISDTLVLTVEGEVQAAVDFVSIVCIRAVACALEKGLPMRGAIGYGSYDLNGTILVGSAIDEVASWYESSEWIGVHLTPSALLRIDNKMEGGLQQFAYTNYQVPMKAGRPIQSLAVNWPRAWRYDLRTEPEKRKKTLMNQFLEMGPLLPEFAGKLMNTIDFYDKVVSSDLKSEQQ